MQSVQRSLIPMTSSTEDILQTLGRQDDRKVVSTKASSLLVACLCPTDVAIRLSATGNPD